MLDTKGIAIDGKQLNQVDLTLVLASSYLIQKIQVFNLYSDEQSKISKITVFVFLTSKGSIDCKQIQRDIPPKQC